MLGLLCSCTISNNFRYRNIKLINSQAYVAAITQQTTVVKMAAIATAIAHFATTAIVKTVAQLLLTANPTVRVIAKKQQL